jgi:hypothetical protein
VLAHRAGPLDGFGDSLGDPLEGSSRCQRNKSPDSGTDYSSHALDRMQQYGIMPSVVEDALTNGTMEFGNYP